MDICQIIFTWLWKSSLFSSILALIILLFKRFFRELNNSKLQYRIWFFLILYLVVPTIPLIMVNAPTLANLTNDMGTNINYGDELLNNGTGSEIGIVDNPDRILGNINQQQFIIISIWLLGVFGFLTFYSSVYFRLKWRLEKTGYEVDPLIKNTFNKCIEILGINQKVNIQINNESCPAVFGILSPRVIIPGQLGEKFSTREIQYILLHELIHIRQNDSLVNGLIILMRAIHWFNPILWYVFTQIQIDQEIACDAYVLETISTSEKKSYGSTLLNASREFSRFPVAIGFIGFPLKMNSIKRRIIMLSKFDKKQTGKGKILIKGVFLFISLLLFTTKLVGSGIKDEAYQTNNDQLVISDEEPIFTVNGGFRKRVYDYGITHTIAFWINGKPELWDNIESLTLYSEDLILYQEKNINNNQYFNNNSFWFQVLVEDETIISSNLKLDLLGVNGDHIVMDQFALKHIDGEMRIREMENNPGELNRDIYNFHFTGIDSHDFTYYLEIYKAYGDTKMVYRKEIKYDEESHKIDFSEFPQGSYLIGLSKHHTGNDLNFVSREYKRYIN